MKKKQKSDQSDYRRLIRRGFLIMRLSILLILLGVLQSAASVYAQNWRFTLDEKNASIKEIMEKIESQSEFRFFYENKLDVDNKLNLKLKNCTIEQVLEQLFNSSGIDYKVLDNNYIVLKSKAEQNFQAVSQQKGSVSGKVVDASGVPLPGVTVAVKGTTQGTITDMDGKYTLTGIPDKAVLVFSFVGMKTEEAPVTSPTINMTLKEETIGIEEVVAIGYGVVKKRDLTGSVASVTGEKLAENPVSNVVQAMQGRLSGVNVISQDGRPGATMSVRVRGGGSITQSNEPLYVVDGVQLSSIDDIPADNIETIDVLKDASSTAIYGARGANGVILITTKSAKEGRTTVKYNVYNQIKQNPSTLGVMDAYDYVLWNWSYATAYGSSYGDGVAKYFGLGSSYGNHLNEYKSVKAHNYINDVMRTANTTNHDLSLTSGTDKTKIYASLNYLNDEGIRIASGYSRWNANFKLDQKINKDLTFNADLRYAESQVDGTSFDRATSAYQYRPIDNPLGDPTYTTGLGQGEPSVSEDYNVVSIINNYQNIADDYSVNGRGSLTWNVFKGLVAKSELSLTRSWGETKYWDAGLETGYSLAKLTKKDGEAVRWATTLNYEVQGLGNNQNLSFLVGNEVLASQSNSTVIQGAGYPSGFDMNDAFGMINMTNVQKDYGKDQFSNTIGTPSHTQSYFGRVNYSLFSRYLLTATFRADGSSKFAPNHRWGYFPAAAVAWRISDEPFLANAKSFLDNLKLRVSYGSSGSDNISPSLWKETWTTKQITVGTNTITTYVPGSMLSNPDLKWETTISRNTGLDFGFLDNRISGTLDFYWNTTKNILMKVPVDPSAGYSYQFQNVGQTSNKGVELALNVDIVRSKDFNLNLTATYNFNKNNIDELSEDALADTHTGWGSSMRLPYYDYIIRKGQPVGVIQGFKSAGYYAVSDFDYDAASGTYTLKTGIPDIKNIVNYPTNVTNGFKKATGQTAFPGCAKFEDISGDGVVNGDDATIIGHTMPKHTGGFALNASYKQFDLSAGFTYQIGGDVYNANAMYSMMGNKDNSLGQNRLRFVKDTYKVYDVNSSGNLQLVTDPTALNTLNENAKYALNYSEYGIASSQFIENASYLRLQNLTFGYTIPKDLIRKIGIQNLRIYFTGTNLFCLTGYSGLDPDVNTDTDGVDGFPTPNYDYNAYPKARTYTMGLNLTF